ncbi:MAG: hypothetical protein WC602_04750 [archaeon]
MKKLIQVLIFLLLLSIVSNAQDTLVTTLGAVHVGKFIEQKKNRILFIPSGSKFDIPQNIPTEMVRYIKGSDGSILYAENVQGENKNTEKSEEDSLKNITMVKSESDLRPTNVKQVLPKDSNMDKIKSDDLTANLQERTVVAIEEIATVEKFFMNYTIVMTVLTVILLVISIK